MKTATRLSAQNLGRDSLPERKSFRTKVAEKHEFTRFFYAQCAYSTSLMFLLFFLGGGGNYTVWRERARFVTVKLIL
jgi:hypothetical protein